MASQNLSLPAHVTWTVHHEKLSGLKSQKKAKADRKTTKVARSSTRSFETQRGIPELNPFGQVTKPLEQVTEPADPWGEVGEEKDEEEEEGGGEEGEEGGREEEEGVRTAEIAACIARAIGGGRAGMGQAVHVRWVVLETSKGTPIYYVSSYCHICVLVLLYLCPHHTYIPVLILLHRWGVVESSKKKKGLFFGLACWSRSDEQYLNIRCWGLDSFF